jgi:hypothetical protein
MLGFCQNIAAQYGIVVDFLIRGKILSEKNSQPIPGIKISQSESNKNFSDSEGNYEIKARSMSDELRIYIADIDGDKNGRFLPLDTFAVNSDKPFAVYLKEEPKMDVFLKENTLFPAEANERKINYIKYIYVRNTDIYVKISKTTKDSKLYFNSKLFYPNSSAEADSQFELFLNEKSNFIVLQNDNKKSEEFIIDDGYEKQTVKLKSDLKNSEAVILIYIK